MKKSRSYLIVVGIVLLAACSASSDSSQPSAVQSSGQGTIPATSSTVADIIDTEHEPASGEFVGALSDISNQTCEQQDDGWHVTGEATNPTAATVDYRIYISLVNGATVTRGLVETEVLSVAAGSVGDFDTVIALPDNDLRCILRVERRSTGT